MVQWIRIRLPMQGTWARSPVQEDSTYLGASKPMQHNWVCTLEPTDHNYWACVLQIRKPEFLKPVLQRSHLSEKPMHHKGKHLLFTAIRENLSTAMKTQSNSSFSPPTFFLSVTNYFGRNAEVDIRKGASPKMRYMSLIYNANTNYQLTFPTL